MTCKKDERPEAGDNNPPYTQSLSFHTMTRDERLCIIDQDRREGYKKGGKVDENAENRQQRLTSVLDKINHKYGKMLKRLAD